MRATLHALAALQLLATGTVCAQQGPLYPWFQRGDPKIQAEVFVRDPDLSLVGRRIGVLPFALPDQGKPEPIDFGPFLRQALLYDGRAAGVVYIAEKREGRPRHASAVDMTEEDRIRDALREGRSRALDLIVLGSVDRMFRTSAGGLVVKTTLQLISTEHSRVVWYGRKRADWLRHFSTEDCLLHLAWLWVTDWRPPEK